MKNLTKNLVMPRPIHLAAAASKPVLNNLLGAIMELFEVNERLEYVDRPHLFIAGNWRHTIYAEFAHIGTRDEVRRGLRKLAEIDFIDLLPPGENGDEYKLRLRPENVMNAMAAAAFANDPSTVTLSPFSNH